jgi:hypothetical protein
VASLGSIALAPARLAVRFLDDVTRMADAAAAMGALARELTPRAQEIADSIGRIADNVENIDVAMTPLDRRVDGVHLPLQGTRRTP